MARLRTKRNKTDIMQLGMAVGGGIVANQVTNLLEKQSFMAGKEQYAPLVTLGVSFLAYMYAPENIKPLALGAIVVSGTEQVEDLLTKVTAGTATTTTQTQGFYNQLGFAPQYMPDYLEESVITAPNGTVIR